MAMKWALTTVLVALSLSGCVINLGDDRTDVAAAVDVVRLTRGEHKMIKWTNEMRHRHRRGRIKVVQPLTDQARIWAGRLAVQGFLSHHRVKWPHCWGQVVGDGPSPRAVFRGFVESRDHRVIILNAAYKAVGVGVIKSGPQRFWIVMNTGC